MAHYPLLWLPQTDRFPSWRPPVHFHDTLRLSEPTGEGQPLTGYSVFPTRLVFPPVGAEESRRNLRRCSPLLSRMHSATNLPFRLGWWTGEAELQ